MSLRLNQILGGADIRSPIFYDSNDTNYYIDAASTSVINILQFAANTAQIIGNTSSSYGSLDVRGVRNGWRGIHFNAGGNAPHLMFDGSANGGVYFETGGRWASYYSYGNNCWGFGTSTTNSAYNIYAPTGVYSGGRVDGTIFYDSNDSTYYVDPASFSLTSSIGIGGLTSSNNVQMYDSYVDASSSYLQSPPLIIRKDSSATGAIDQAPVGLFIYNLNGTNNTWTKLSMGSREAAGAGNTVSIAGLAAQKTAGTANNWATGNLHFWTKAGGTQITNMVAYSAGYVQSDYSFRSPIFYDSNNTSYYLDPASTSNLNVVNLVGITGAGNAYIQTTSTGTSYTSHFQIREANGGGGNTSEIYAPALGFHWSGVVASNILMESSGRIAIRNNPGSGYENFIANAIYGAVFYDSNDVTYYTDPSSLSNILELKTNKNWYDSSASAWGGGINMGGNNPTIGFQSTSSTWWYMLHHASSNINFYRRSTSGSWNHDGIWDSSGNLIWQGSSVRAPIFYDQNNTAYYIDAASTSNLNAITAAGNITAAQYYTGGWFRNNGSGNGLYNESTTQHFYSDDVSYWNVASSSSAQGIRFRTGGHGGTVRGYVYANNGNDVGFLNNGGNWRARIVGGDYFLADGSSIRGQIFYDSNDTNYYCDPNSSSVLSSVTANAYYPRAAVTESDIYAQSLSINAYHHGDSLTYDTFQFNAASAYETRATVGASFVSGTVETSIFKGDRFGGMSIANGVYQVRWTWNNTIGYKFFKTLYLGNSTNGNSFTVTIEASGNGSTWTTIATSTAMSNWPGHSWYNYAWNNNAYQGYIRLTITPSWSTVYGIDIYSMRYFCSYSLDAGSRLYDWDYSKNVTFAAAVSSPIFYDSNNTGYYVNPASQSKLNNLLIDTGSSNTSMTIVGSNQPSIFLKTTDNERNIEIFNSYGNFGIYRINAPSNYIIYHVDNGASSYTYFQLEGTARLTINSSGSTATTSVRSPIFYDSDNTAYFIDGAGTSNILGLTVNNTITGSVSGNAGTATTLQTARNINGTSFNGSANITTASWGTARTITIGATGKSVDGSANASWSLAEITGSQTANTFLAAPNGSAGNPTFRAIVAADIPTLNQNTTGTAANVTGTVAIANGGTGATTAANAATNLGLGTGNTPKFLNVFGERASVTASASTTVNTQFNVTELTMSASITTLTLSNIQANTIVHMWTIVTLGNGTGYSITWPAAIKWPGGTAPTITSTNAKRDIYQFVTYDGGTNIYAIIVGQNL